MAKSQFVNGAVLWGRDFHDKDDIFKAIHQARALIRMVEAVQYASQCLDGDFNHIGAELRGTIHDYAIADLRHYIDEMEEAVGDVPDKNAGLSAPSIAKELAKMTGLED